VAQEREAVDITFNSNGHAISGKMLKPRETPKQLPALVFLVGSGGGASYRTNYETFLQEFFENSLPSDGFVLLYFDKRGLGESEGKWFRSTFEDRATDANAAGLFLKSQSFVDPNKIFVVGHSQGAWVAQVSLSKYPDTFAGGISMSGAIHSVEKQLVSDYESEYYCEGGLDRELSHVKATKKAKRNIKLVSILPISKNLKHMKLIRSFDSKPYVRGITKPMLFMFGENDNLVYPEWSKDGLNEIYGDSIPSYFDIEIIEGVDHGFKETAFCRTEPYSNLKRSQKAKELVRSWLLTQTGR